MEIHSFSIVSIYLSLFFNRIIVLHSVFLSLRCIFPCFTSKIHVSNANSIHRNENDKIQKRFSETAAHAQSAARIKKYFFPK